jgi:hypothetical protein
MTPDKSGTGVPRSDVQRPNSLRKENVRSEWSWLNYRAPLVRGHCGYTRFLQLGRIDTKIVQKANTWMALTALAGELSNHHLMHIEST